MMDPNATGCTIEDDFKTFLISRGCSEEEIQCFVENSVLSIDDFIALDPQDLMDELGWKKMKAKSLLNAAARLQKKSSTPSTPPPPSSEPETTPSDSAIYEEEEVIAEPPKVERTSGEAKSKTRVVLFQGDITSLRVEVIVNAANRRLALGAGVAGAIRSAGGPSIQAECDGIIRHNGGLSIDVGEVVVTGGGKLFASFVFHAVGPSCQDGRLSPVIIKQYRNAVRNILERTEEYGASSVAIPPISTGIFGFPINEASSLMANEIAAFVTRRPEHVRKIILCDIGKSFLPRVRDDLRGLGIETEGRVQSSHSSTSSHSSSPMKPKWSTPDRHRSYPPSHLGPLSSAERGIAKAAGVIPVRVCKGRVEVLLGLERRMISEVNSFRVCLHPLGGSIDYGESSRDAAARELREETAKLVSKREVSSLLERCQSVWIPDGKYHLLVARCNSTKTWNDLPRNYNKMGWRPHGAEPERIHWVNWKVLLNAFRNGARVKIQRGTYRLGDFLKKILAHETVHTAIDNAVNKRGDVSSGASPLSKWDRIDAGAVSSSPSTFSSDPFLHGGDDDGVDVDSFVDATSIKAELRKMEKYARLDASAYEENVLGDDWKLDISVNTVPKALPITTVIPTDPTYKKIANQLGSTPQRSSIASIRVVNVPVRKHDFEAAAKGATKLRPLFHGTPERWRATSIATAGFKLMAKPLHGAAHGAGVYTSTTISDPLGYCGGAGSILCCVGGVDASTKTVGAWRVFPNPRMVLPEHIIDFSDDSHDRQAMIDAVEEERIREAKLLKELVENAKKDERKYVVDSFNRFKKAVQAYKKELEGFSPERTPLAKFESIKSHFDKMLPIFTQKDHVLSKMKENDVLVILAPTGTGKSTQLPQYVLDDLFVDDDHDGKIEEVHAGDISDDGESIDTSTAEEARKPLKKVIVLEPRRVNARSLAKRVARERGGTVGEETGYKLGGGVIFAKPETRIEYMTHGFFVALAMGKEKELPDSYGAVIVDEAHERSVQIDLSLGILKRTLEQRGDRSFKVIITSATVDPKEAGKFRDFFATPSVRSTIVRLDATSYPVVVLNRGKLDPPPGEVGTAGVGRILSSVAVNAAMEVLEMGTKGNILVFMPGKAAIRRALEDFRGRFSKDAFGASGYHYDDTLGFPVKMPAKKKKSAKDKDDPKSSKNITVGIYPLYGNLTESEKDRVLRYTEDRIVVFATNVAETGLTIPEVRYVIDTGLENHVVWNPSTGMSEMRTSWITKSSMQQRTGRAGRTSSGFCLRLYSEEKQEGFASLPEPGLSSKNLDRVVLCQRSVPKELPLLDEMNKDLVKDAEVELKRLEAIDDDGNITERGKILSDLGMSLRMGMFLIISSKLGVGEAAAKICSMISAYGEYMLPRRNAPCTYKKYLDPSGDHLTLRNLFNAYHHAKSKLNWVHKYRLDRATFESAEMVYQNLLEKMINTEGLSPAQEDDEEYVRSKILQALCAAHYDQIMAARVPGSPSNNFDRVLPQRQGKELSEAIDQFKRSTGPSSGSPPSTDSPNLTVRLASTSALWPFDKSGSGGDDDGSSSSAKAFAVFGSMILTDASTAPSVNLVSLVSEEHVLSSLKTFGGDVNARALVERSMRRTTTFKGKIGGAWLKKLQRKLPSIVAKLIPGGGGFEVSAPADYMPLIEAKLRKAESEMEAEMIELPVPPECRLDWGSFIGKGGAEIKKLREDVKKAVQLVCTGNPPAPGVKADKGASVITLTLRGNAKRGMDVAIGTIRSAIYKHSRNRDEHIPFLPKGKRGSTGCTSRHGRLCSSAPPLSIEMFRRNPNDNDAKLIIAHAILWKCDGTIFGGFVRDWVCAGKPAQDIDFLYGTTSSHDAQKNIIDNVANSLSLNRIVNKKNGSCAWKRIYKHSTKGFEVEIDFVDRTKQVRVSTNPGVECDAGNLQMSKNGPSVRIKNPKLLGHRESWEHATKSQFVPYYNYSNTNQRNIDRLNEKYFERGWTCIGYLDEAVRKKCSYYRDSLYAPKPEYRREWWNM